MIDPRLTSDQYYVQPICSPTRSALMTGTMLPLYNAALLLLTLIQADTRSTSAHNPMSSSGTRLGVFLSIKRFFLR